MADCTILGMPLAAGEDDTITTAQPLCGFAVVKALDEDGGIVYLTGATEGLSSVECLGMAEYAALKLRHRIAARLDED